MNNNGVTLVKHSFNKQHSSDSNQQIQSRIIPMNPTPLYILLSSSSQ